MNLSCSQQDGFPIPYYGGLTKFVPGSDVFSLSLVVI